MPLHLSPLVVPLGPMALSVHPIFESLAYFTGYRLYLYQRKRAGDFLNSPDRLWIVCAAIAGAAIGSKVLALLEQPSDALSHWREPLYLMQGKTVIGGFLGGTLLVEWTKRKLGIERRTGDLFAVPLAVGTAVGRVGCLLTGLPDRTYGSATTVPWAVDFGDGVARHPTQAYEIVFLLWFAPVLWRFNQRPHREGDTYRLFLLGYCAWRLAVDFLKPDPRWWGLSSIQWACVGALLWYSRDLPAILWFRRGDAHG